MSMVERIKRIEERLYKERIKLVNECAAIAYENMGYRVNHGYDFSKATHPQEQAAFAIAVRIYNHIKDSES